MVAAKHRLAGVAGGVQRVDPAADLAEPPADPATSILGQAAQWGELSLPVGHGASADAVGAGEKEGQLDGRVLGRVAAVDGVALDG